MNRNNMLGKLVDAVETLFGYIDAIPAELANQFPVMPGCNRDDIEADIAEVKSNQKKLAASVVSIAASVAPIDGEQVVCAVKMSLKHNSQIEFIDWLAGQNAIADSTGFMSAAYCGNKSSTDAFYRYLGDPHDVLPSLPKGQSYVWLTIP